jgi:hypothetical protein
MNKSIKKKKLAREGIRPYLVGKQKKEGKRNNG